MTVPYLIPCWYFQADLLKKYVNEISQYFYHFFAESTVFRDNEQFIVTFLVSGKVVTQHRSSDPPPLISIMREAKTSYLFFGTSFMHCPLLFIHSIYSYLIPWILVFRVFLNSCISWPLRTNSDITSELQGIWTSARLWTQRIVSYALLSILSWRIYFLLV